MTPPPRGFPASEFRSRCTNAQSLMAQAGLDALLLTTEAEVRYYTGFLTRFWESPTRPWFVVLPLSGEPIAVIPEIGAHLMGQTWISDIRTWQSPDRDDDGVTLLANTLCDGTPEAGKIGVADQLESHLRMPLADFRRLETLIGTRAICGDQGVTSALRNIKSALEIAKIKKATGIADRAFDHVQDIASAGTPLSQVFRDFQRLCLESGADWVPYLAGGAGQGGYGDVISPATDAPLRQGDVLMLDTGLVWDGYFCDFDRNFSLGKPTATVQEAHSALIEATQAAFAIARPGALMSDLFHAMHAIVDPSGKNGAAGRLGHGLGMQLTEGPSITSQDDTPLEPGMVLTLEPGITLPEGQIMVHEEDIVITQAAPEWLSTPQHADIRVL